MQSHILKSRRGFTLTEVLIVGILAAVLGMGIISLLTWMFSGSRHDQKVSHLQTEANVVLESVGRRVRASSSVHSPSNKHVDFYTGGAITGSLSIVGDTLKENGIAFIVSGTPILLDGAGSTIYADTTNETVDLELVLRRDDARFTLHTGNLRCRN